MQINITCDSWEELGEFVRKYADHGARLMIPAEEIFKASEKAKANEAKKEEPTAPAEPVKEEKPKKVTSKKEKPADEAPATSDEDFRPATPEDGVPKEFLDGDDATTAKLLLADLAKSGKRTKLKELLASFGVAKLTELIEKQPDKIPEFCQKARAL